MAKPQEEKSAVENGRRDHTRNVFFVGFFMGMHDRTLSLCDWDFNLAKIDRDRKGRSEIQPHRLGHPSYFSSLGHLLLSQPREHLQNGVLIVRTMPEGHFFFGFTPMAFR